MVGLVLALSPYSGPPINGSISDSAKFSVAIRGNAGQVVVVRAVDLPKGYIASFCTARVCAPFRVTFALPKSGRERIELQLIENEAGATKPTTVSVRADGATASIRFSRGSH